MWVLEVRYSCYGFVCVNCLHNRQFMSSGYLIWLEGNDTSYRHACIRQFVASRRKHFSSNTHSLHPLIPFSSIQIILLLTSSIVDTSQYSGVITDLSLDHLHQRQRDFTTLINEYLNINYYCAISCAMLNDLN